MLLWRLHTPTLSVTTYPVLPWQRSLTSWLSPLLLVEWIGLIFIGPRFLLFPKAPLRLVANECQLDHTLLVIFWTSPLLTAAETLEGGVGRGEVFSCFLFWPHPVIFHSGTSHQTPGLIILNSLQCHSQAPNLWNTQNDNSCARLWLVSSDAWAQEESCSFQQHSV